MTFQLLTITILPVVAEQWLSQKMSLPTRARHFCAAEQNGSKWFKFKIGVIDGVLTCFIFHLFGRNLILDITGIDIVAVGTFMGSVGTSVAAVIKAVKSSNEAKAAKAETEAIQLQRKEATALRDNQVQELQTGFALLKKEVENHNERLNEGNEKFEELSKEMKEQNGLLREILVALKIKFNLPIGEAHL